MTYMFPVWWAQYEGAEQYKNYYNGVYYDAASGRTYNNDVRTVSQQGRLESLEILEEIYRGHDGGGILTKVPSQTNIFRDRRRCSCATG